ncbi:hypothetical protein RIE95_13290 [Acidithiobacillus thiooxidans]|uniref:hypothetical protein n=1 Tax=Acidithiobacillus thiooxidans TaxID=930 RepID=UPI00285C52EA|nr:hypothetical protein [Acidithiobacillus thiooxidans]MDR7927954.1 hypothetical protein [Acidithiobacillus thiooxidans]
MQNMRRKLADYCRAWREFLKDTFRGYERWPDGEARYKERWERLDAVLADFQRAPTNFDSRFEVGTHEAAGFAVFISVPDIVTSCTRISLSDNSP